MINIIVSGPEEVVDLFSDILREEKIRSNNSRYPIGSVVRVSQDVYKIMEVLTPVYNLIDARLHAKDIAGSIVEVIGVDELVDEHGNLGTYYTIELDDGRFYVLPENLLSKR